MKALHPVLRALLFLACFGAVAARAGTVSGNVVDSTNQPIGGVKVCALQRSFALQLEPTGAFAIVGCQDTAADGRYEIALAQAGSYLLQIDEEHLQAAGLDFIAEYHTGDAVVVLPPAYVRLLPVGAEQTVTANFKLERGYRFSGRIVERDSGAPIAKVLVCLLNTGTPAKTPWMCFPSGANGDYRTLPLPAGSYKLYTYNELGYVDVFNGDRMAFDPRSLSWTDSLLLNGDVNQGFYLRKGHTISGTVRDFTNLPVYDSVVCLQSWSQYGLASFGCTQTLNGYYETPALPGGNYLLYVRGTPDLIGTLSDGAVFDNDATLNQMLPFSLQSNLTDYDLAADKPVHFSGTVTRDGGLPVAGATVCFYRRHGRQYFYDLHDCVLADAQGHYQSKAMAAGYYGVTTGIGPVQHVAYDGSPVPLEGLTTVFNPLIVTTDMTLDLDYSLPAAERIAYLSGNIAEYREPIDWPSQERIRAQASLSLIVREAALLGNELSAMAASELTRDAALDAAEVIGAAVEAGVAPLTWGYNPDASPVYAAASSLARLVRTLDIDEPDPNAAYSRHARLRALTLRVFESLTALRFAQNEAASIESTSAALAAILNSALSQGIQFDLEFIEAFKEYSDTTGRLTTTFARELLAARGVTRWGALDDLPADLAAVPLALQAYVQATALPLDLQDSEQSLTVMRKALQSAGMTHLQAQDANGQVNLVTAKGVIPAVAGIVLVVSSLVPNGVVMLPDGSALAVDERVAVQVVPAPVNPGALGNLLGAFGEFTLGEDGSVQFRENGAKLSATLNFQNVVSTAGATGPAQLERPTNLASLASDDVFRVRYANGTTQTLAPFVSAPDFFTSLSKLGLPYQVNRATGVIVVNGRSYRPSFIVNAPDAADLAFHAQAVRPQGIAYRPGDFNGDGKTDYKVITAASAQVVYGL